MDFNQTQLPDNPLVRAAFELASAYHDGQFRKGATEPLLPYINHPLAVAHKIIDACGSDIRPELVAAALCHDLVEDTEATDQVIRKALGNCVADLVAEVTDPSHLNGAELRAYQVEHASHMSDDAKALKLSDRIENLYSMAYDVPPEWNYYTRSKYIENSQKLFSALKGTHAGLDYRMERALAAAQERLVIDIGREMEKNGTDMKSLRRCGHFVRRIARAFRDGELKLEHVDPTARTEMPQQDSTNLKHLYEEALHAQSEIAALAQNLSIKLNLEAIDPGVKEKERVIEKAGSRDNDNDPSRITDIARVSLICDTMAEVRRAERALEAHANIAYSHDLFVKPTSVNYADLTKLVRTSNGHLAEFKIQLRDMYEAGQNGCHDCYKELRSIYVIQSQRPLEKEEKKRKKELTNQIRRTYRTVLETHGLLQDTVAETDVTHLATLSTETPVPVGMNHVVQAEVNMTPISDLSARPLGQQQSQNRTAKPKAGGPA